MASLFIQTGSSKRLDTCISISERRLHFNRPKEIYYYYFHRLFTVFYYMVLKGSIFLKKKKKKKKKKKIDIFIQERFNKLISGINTIINCGI